MLPRRAFVPFLLALFVLLVCAQMATAGTIIAAVSGVTNMGEEYPLANAFNQTGLSVGYVSGVTDFDTYIALDPTHYSEPGTDWISSLTTGRADFNLGQLASIDRVAIWNFAANTDYAITSIHLWGSAEASFGSPIDLGAFILAVPPFEPAHAQILSFDAASLQYVRMEVLANNGEVPGSALGEIAFATAAVPEPSTLTLLGAALAVLGVGRLSRRRRR